MSVAEARSAHQSAGPGRPFAEQNGRIGVRGVLRTGLLVLCAVFVTTAGACRGDEPSGPPPSPSELSGTPLPEGAVTTDVNATLGTPTFGGRVPSGCYFFVGVTADGSAGTWRGCGDSAAAAANEFSRERTDQVGDYGLVAGELIVRTVEWDWLSEAYQLTEYLFEQCSVTGAPAGDVVQGTGPVHYRAGEPWLLVEGMLGAQVASDDSCWSVSRSVRWLGD